MSKLLPTDCESCCATFVRIQAIESLLRNSLPHDDPDIANPIAGAHALTERLLEDMLEGWL